jgi:hypothetical protein
MVPGLIWGSAGMTLIGIARASFTIGSELSGSDIARLASTHGFTVMTMLFGLCFSASAAFVFESTGESAYISLPTLGIMTINAVSIIGSTFTGTTLFVYSPIEAGKPIFTNVPISMTDFLTSSVSNLLVMLAATHSSPASVVVWSQIFASLAGSVFLLGGSEIHYTILSTIFFIQDQVSKRFRLPLPESPKYSRTFTLGAIFAVIVAFSWSLSCLSYLAISEIRSGPLALLDLRYKPVSRFDIVVSMFNEDPSSVGEMLDSIRKTNLLSTLSPNVIIYTKNRNVDVSALQKTTRASSVRVLDNVGREGGTYLHHIVHNWDNLAKQTLFIQAHAHNMREMIPRLDSYLVPDTGMLSLGFTGVQCECGKCEDRHGWKDSFHLIPSLYYMIYDQTCDPKNPILLSYKGQFVASGRRIRGINRQVYEELLEAITSEHGWSHDRDIVKDNFDTSDNPFFGYTLERVWGLLMQCATNGAVATKCPSLLSGMRHGGDVEDCQCLDSERFQL